MYGAAMMDLDGIPDENDAPENNTMGMMGDDFPEKEPLQIGYHGFASCPADHCCSLHC
jgi:hypothetical protein